MDNKYTLNIEEISEATPSTDYTYPDNIIFEILSYYPSQPPYDLHSTYFYILHMFNQHNTIENISSILGTPTTTIQYNLQESLTQLSSSDNKLMLTLGLSEYYREKYSLTIEKVKESDFNYFTSRLEKIEQYYRTQISKLTTKLLNFENPPDPILNNSLKDLGFSKSLRNLLSSSYSVETLSDLLKLDASSIFNIKKFGYKRFIELQHRLQQLGYTINY